MRKLMWFTIGYAASCALGTYGLRGGWLMLCVLASAFAGVAAFRFRGHPVVKRLFAAVIGFAAGCAAFCGYEWLYLKSAAAMDGQVTPISVRITDFSWQTDYGTAADGVVTLDDKEYSIRLYLSEDTALSPGDTVGTEAKLRLTDEGGEREPTFHRADGMLLLGYQRGGTSITTGEPEWRDFPALWRARLLEILDQCFPTDAAGFARALLLGDKTGLSHAQTTHFSVTGISHVVAVSGLHISILFTLVQLFTRKRRWLTVLIGVPVLLIFAAMAGFTASVTRAVLMQLLMLLALAAGREYDPPTSLSFACLVMLARCPLVISSVGFQLSALSVAGIFLFASPLRMTILARMPGQGKGKSHSARLIRWFAVSVSVTLSATVMTTALSAVYFHTVSLVGVVTNLLVLPVISVTFYGIMLVCLLGLMSLPAGAMAAALAAWPIRYVLGVAAVLAKVPLGAVYTESVYVTIWLVLVYGLVLWAALTGGKTRIAVFGGVIGLSIALLLSFAEPLLWDYRVTALDVGQGQCLILQSRGHTFVVDCGGDHDETTGDMAARTLLSQGIDHIDGLILTHYDRDHIGGAAYLSERIRIETLYLPGEDVSAQAEAIVAEERLTVTDINEVDFGGAKITIIPPESGQSDNENSLSVLFQREKCDTLITGDLSAAGERALLKSTALPDLEVLIVGHHGSKYSTCDELLKLTAPDVAIISAGADNSYGHPAPETLERLARYDCAVFRTDLHGTIVYRG